MSNKDNLSDLIIEVLKEHGIQGTIKNIMVEFDDIMDYCVNYCIYIYLGVGYGPESLQPIEEEINLLAYSQGILYEGVVPVRVVIEWC